MSERVALMNAGHIEQIAEPEAIYRNPQTLFAARFIGAGSFVPGVAGARSPLRVEVAVAGRSVLAIDAGVGSARRVQVLFRPEQLEVGPPEGSDGLPGIVEVCAFFGSHYEATIACDGTALRARSTVALAPGAQVSVKWAAQSGIAYPDPEPADGG